MASLATICVVILYLCCCCCDMFALVLPFCSLALPLPSLVVFTAMPHNPAFAKAKCNTKAKAKTKANAKVTGNTKATANAKRNVKVTANANAKGTAKAKAKVKCKAKAKTNSNVNVSGVLHNLVDVSDESSVRLSNDYRLINVAATDDAADNINVDARDVAELPGMVHTDVAAVTMHAQDGSVTHLQAFDEGDGPALVAAAAFLIRVLNMDRHALLLWFGGMGGA